MGKTDLGKWMITNGGEYSADATYEQLTMVKYGNSTYITLKTVTGIAPTDDKINYQLMAQGFDATALSAVQAEDTQGLCGEKGEIVTAQSLVDALADKVINTVMAKIGTAALTGGMTDLSSGVNSLYSNIEMLGTRVLFENNPPYKIGNNLSEIIEKLDGWSINMRANTFYVGIIFIGVAGYSLSGGSWNIIGCKTSNAYEWQMAIKYSENTGITVTARSKINNIWNSWGNIT